MIARATIQRVQDTADILDVVGHFIKLKRRGANYLGLCPFHGEKTPSFTVSPSKGIYKCFGCGKAGNAVTFIQEHEKMTFPEAITWLAKRYNIEIEETQVSQEEKEQQLAEEALRIVNQFAAGWFSEQLEQSEEGQQIGLSYFRERGFRSEIIHKFQLGYCPEQGQLLTDDALAKGYNPELLIKAGLLTERQGRLTAVYAGRVIFPIHNQSGKVIGFGARTLKNNDRSPKYINTPENELYHKSRTLYGIYQARSAISKVDECYLVEGYTDVISLQQAGVEQVVASSGTSLTEEQLRLIKRFTKNLTILYDGDAAGIKAALRGLDMAVEQGLNVSVVLLPQNHDPDSFVQETGAQGFNDFIRENRKDIILFKLEASLREAKDDSLKKTALINEIAETLSKINKLEDFTKQDDYIRRCSELLQVDEAGLVSLVNKKIRERNLKKEGADRQEIDTLAKQAEPEKVHQQDDATALLQKDYLQEKGLLRILMEYGNRPYDEKLSVAEYIRIKVEDADFAHANWKQLYDVYMEEWARRNDYPNEKVFTYHDNETVRSAAIEALYFPYELSTRWASEHQIFTPTRDMVLRDDVDHTITYFILRKVKALLHQVLDEMKQIGSPEEEQELFHTWSELKKLEKELLQHLRVVAVK